MSQQFNYRHLYYLWVVAKEGGISRAAARLGLAVQTVSTQLRELERTLGHALLAPAGRGVALTPAGDAAVRQAEQIFQLGEALPAQVREAATVVGPRLAVGISQGLPKLAVRLLLAPLTGTPQLRLLCHEDRFDDLLADLALHRLDVVLADRPAPPQPGLRVYSHPMGQSALAWYAPPSLLATAQADFPRSLSQVPLLLPTHHAAVRARLDHWLSQHGITPQVAGEFDDSALLATFGASGMGVFPAAELVQDKLLQRYQLLRVGPCDGVDERFWAIDTEKRVRHPLVQRLLPRP
jgi:LysR family transcriptional regulator, transcriptional activator of nhaA